MSSVSVKIGVLGLLIYHDFAAESIDLN